MKTSEEKAEIRPCHFENERDGQIDFFDNFKIDYINNPILVDYTDGVYNGNLLEFKLHIKNLNTALFQAIVYLSRMRVKGESVPANILLVSVNDRKLYLYKSERYLKYINRVYYGAASRISEDFIAGEYECKFDYASESGAYEVVKILRQKEYVAITLDENCIVGWAERYYRENPMASKGDFIGDCTGKVKIVGEIREPKYFKGLIKPYLGKTNERFKYLMDRLNDRLRKKDLGAFYTPIKYCELAVRLLREAIARVPKGNDYMIIDRCAGTGNLESVLTDEELSHCILSTYEYYEYKVLCERLGDKAYIIPPTEESLIYQQGFVKNADALSMEFINNPIVRKYVDDPRYTIILFENPPYQDSSSFTFIDGDNKRAKSSRNSSFVKSEFTKEIYKLNEQNGAAREISNLFIWSAFKYYLRQPTDSYIVFSPVKYFKSIGLVNKRFIDGFAFNRKHFHASASVVSCVLWSNEDAIQDRWMLKTYDIAGDGSLLKCPSVCVKRVKHRVAEYNDRRFFPSDIETSVVCSSNGSEKIGWNSDRKRARGNENIIGYMVFIGYSTDSKHRGLTRLPYWVGVEQSFGFYLRSDNFIEKLPIFCAKLFPQSKWYEKDVYYTSSDMGYAYAKDEDLLRRCLIYTCLSDANKCHSILASDNKLYQNELSFDFDTLASRTLEQMSQTEDDASLMRLWYTILDEAQKTLNYNPLFKYGSDQINMELNTFVKDEFGRRIYDYPELNGLLISLKQNLKQYYEDNIRPLLFKYELLK